MVVISCTLHTFWANVSTGQVKCRFPILHSTAPHGIMYISMSPKKWKGPSAFFWFNLKKIFVPLFFFSLHLKQLGLYAYEMPLSCIPLDNYTLLFFKRSVCRSKCTEPMCMERNKSIALGTHPPKWECHKPTAQGRNRSPGSAQLCQRKATFFQNCYEDINGQSLLESSCWQFL